MKVQLEITGMTCAGCQKSVTEILLRQPGVTAARVELATGRAVVEGDAEPGQLVSAIEAGGFDARPVVDT